MREIVYPSCVTLVEQERSRVVDDVTHVECSSFDSFFACNVVVIAVKDTDAVQISTFYIISSCTIFSILVSRVQSLP